MNWTPLGDQVLLEVEKESEKTKNTPSFFFKR